MENVEGRQVELEGMKGLGLELVHEARGYKSYFDHSQRVVFTMLKPKVKVDFARIAFNYAGALLPDKIGSDWDCKEEEFLSAWAKLTGQKPAKTVVKVVKVKTISKKCLKCASYQKSLCF